VTSCFLSPSDVDPSPPQPLSLGGSRLAVWIAKGYSLPNPYIRFSRRPREQMSFSLCERLELPPRPQRMVPSPRSRPIPPSPKASPCKNFPPPPPPPPPPPILIRTLENKRSFLWFPPLSACVRIGKWLSGPFFPMTAGPGLSLFWILSLLVILFFSAIPDLLTHKNF